MSVIVKCSYDAAGLGVVDWWLCWVDCVACFACLRVGGLFPGWLFVLLFRVVVGNLLLHRWLICSRLR